jgi:pimeloyl-ACP methyl ester carboxylesterase
MFKLPGLRLAAVCLTLLCGILPASAAGNIGIVLLHGKTGGPDQMASLSTALTAAGYPVEVPELCWSKKRIFDKTFADCLIEVDAAVASLKAKGATRIVIAGVSQGAIGAFGYGAARSGLAGIIGMAPAADPVNLTKYPGLAQGIDKAKGLIADGHGDAPTHLIDITTGGKDITIKTTANIYMSFHATDAPISTIPNLTAEILPKQMAPVMWVAGTRDPSQANAPRAYAALPANSLNRYATVDADHGGTPDASGDVIIAWIKTLP